LGIQLRSLVDKSGIVADLPGHDVAVRSLVAIDVKYDQVDLIPGHQEVVLDVIQPVNLAHRHLTSFMDISESNLMRGTV
jgi:hypothetical protein